VCDHPLGARCDYVARGEWPSRIRAVDFGQPTQTLIVQKPSKCTNLPGERQGGIMLRSSDRPYGSSSISELEAVFRHGKADAEILRKLDHELGHRSTKRALKLRSIVGEARAARPNSDLVAPSTAVSKRPITPSSAGVTPLLSAAKQSVSPPAPNPAPKTAPFTDSAALPGVQNIEPLPCPRYQRAGMNPSPASDHRQPDDVTRLDVVGTGPRS